nr:hypothetical protein [uncultured Macellibacteroides sp.]
MNTKRSLHLFIITFTILISGFYSCERNYLLPKEMGIAKEIMLERPDSALKILEEFKNIDDLPVQLRATYNLLLIEARDKNYVVHTSDSLINTVVNYFEHSDDPVMKAKAYFYQGRVNKDMQQVEKAALCFKKAETVANGTKEYRLQALICNHLADLSLYQNLYEDALSWNKKAYKAMLQFGDTASTYIILRDMARSTTLLQKYDQSSVYFNEALSIADRYKNKQIESVLYYEISLMYDHRQMQDSAFFYVQKSLNTDRDIINMNEICLGISDTYRKSHQLDSARFYLEKCANNNDLYAKTGYYMILAKIEEDAGNYKESLAKYKLSSDYQDSIRSISSAEALAGVVAKYDNEKLENEKNQILLEKTRAWRNYYFILSASLMLTVAFVIIFFTFKRRKERQLQENINKLIVYEKQIAENNKMLKANETWIRKTVKQMSEANDELVKKENQLTLLKRKTEETAELKRETEHLERTMRDLKDQISSLSKKKRQIIAMNEQIKSQTSLIERLQVWTPGDPFLTDAEWTHLPELMNQQFNNFSKRLEENFPDLTMHDIRICNLTKLGLTNETIANLTNCKYESLLTKRTRIKKLRMHVDGDISLEEIIQRFE